jgi:2,4-dienoyl-CoA reductase-like NADH-dependent reductase (Old Yellow Enzyme family)
MTTSRLFQPITIRGFTARNRIMVSPMQQYATDDSGVANDYHLVHIGRFALGGAGLVVLEATAIAPEARISHGDLGLWCDAQIEPLARVARFVKQYGGVPGIQLIHAGRKGSMQAPWDGLGPLGNSDAARGEPPWPLVGPSGIAAGPDWPVPAELTEPDLQRIVREWADAARRAAKAGFDIIDFHGAHGYLLHSFLSPISNHRRDRYGGSLENRMRFPLQVVEAVREAFPSDRALFYRLSALDGIDGGWTLEESMVFCRELYARGIDVIDVSSGGAIADRSSDVRVRRGFAFHAPYSHALRDALGGLVATVGLIVDPHQAEAVLRAGDADIVVVGREVLHDPNWPLHARSVLEGEDFNAWHREAGWWLDKRASVLKRLAASGETPMTRYEMRPKDSAES